MMSLKIFLSVSLALGNLIGNGLCIKVIRSQLKLDQDGEGISGAKLVDDRLVDITDVTFCIRFNYKILGDWEEKSQLIHIEDWRPDAAALTMSFLTFGANFPNSFFGFGHPREEGAYKSYVIRDPDTGDYEVWATNRWSHACLSYRKSDGLVRVVKDGKITNVNYNNENGLPKMVIPDNFLNKTYLGRCSFDYKMACSSPDGQISDFNVWDRALTEKEAIEWTSCKSLSKGNLVNWDTALLSLENMLESDTSMTTICVPIRPGHVLMPMPRNFTSHNSLCSKWKGRVSVIREMETQISMNEEALKYPSCGDPNDAESGRYWAGWHDVEKEGTFTDANSGDELNFSYKPWYLGEPNGDTLENCAEVWMERNAWNDVKCSQEKCAFCELEQAPDIQIRGLCSDSVFDTKYSWTRELINGRHSFRGYKGTMLQYNENTNQWTLKPHKSSEDILALVENREYPFGIHSWTISGDACSDQNTTDVLLSINACNYTEFNCDDGSCIDINKRCNAYTDCPDKSDEFGCDILTTDKSYLKDVPPPSFSTSTLTNVNVSVDILQVLEIIEVQNTISLQAELKLTWVDRRLIFTNLKKEKNLNTLIPEFRKQIWIPQVVFHNTREKSESLNDEKAFATIERSGPYVQSPKSELRNAYIFKGLENPITISRVYDAEFLCDFNMEMFPFDTQECSIILTTKGNTNNFIKLTGSFLNYSGPIDLTQYFIKDVTMQDNVEVNAKRALKVDLIFGRRVLATVLTTYLPTMLLCLVCFSTNYFKPFFFEAVVTVNLTSLLCLITLFVSLFNSLPTTAYVKFIDIWLIFTLLVPFSEVLLHTYIDSLRIEENREVNHHGQSIPIQPMPDVEKPVVKRPDRVSPHVRRDKKLISRDEVAELRARKDFYDKVKLINRNKLAVATKVARYGLPLIFLLFAFVYFGVGFVYYQSNQAEWTAPKE